MFVLLLLRKQAVNEECKSKSIFLKNRIRINDSKTFIYFIIHAI